MMDAGATQGHRGKTGRQPREREATPTLSLKSQGLGDHDTWGERQIVISEGDRDLADETRNVTNGG